VSERVNGNIAEVINFKTLKILTRFKRIVAMVLLLGLLGFGASSIVWYSE
jgi:hypothetical protein